MGMKPEDIAVAVHDVIGQELRATPWGQAMVEAATDAATEAEPGAVTDPAKDRAVREAARPHVRRHLAHLAGRLGEPIDPAR